MAFSTTGTSGDGPSSEINVTPLIDVLLVLLIIFMVIAPVLPRGLNSALPSVVPRVVEAAEYPILVQVEQGERGVQYVPDGVGLEKTEVGPRLRDLLARRSVRQVVLKGDAKLDFGVIAREMDAGQAAGAESVGSLTRGWGFGRDRHNAHTLSDVLSSHCNRNGAVFCALFHAIWIRLEPC